MARRSSSRAISRRVSPAWQKSGVGAGTTVKWKTGTGEQGNPGVAGFIGQTEGSIGYIELYYALLKKDEIKFGAVQNQAGKFILADLKGVTLAAENSLKDKKRITDDLNMDLLNAPGEESYPISGATWAVLYTKQRAATGQGARRFLHVGHSRRPKVQREHALRSSARSARQTDR